MLAQPQVKLCLGTPLHRGRGDKYLADHAQDLQRLLAKTQLSFEPAARLPERQLQELAVVLVEFAEDLHNDIGLWLNAPDGSVRDF